MRKRNIRRREGKNRRACGRHRCRDVCFPEHSYCRKHYNEHTRQLRKIKKDLGVTGQADYGSCEHCKKNGIKTPATVVDHEHKTGAFRGYLCKSCNKIDVLK